MSPQIATFNLDSRLPAGVKNRRFPLMLYL